MPWNEIGISLRNQRIGSGILPLQLGFENSVNYYRAFYLAGAVPSLYLIFPARRGHHITFLSDTMGFYVKFLMYLPLKE